MPAFEDEDIVKMQELMTEEAKQRFLIKKKRLEDQRQKEIDDLENMLKEE